MSREEINTKEGLNGNEKRKIGKKIKEMRKRGKKEKSGKWRRDERARKQFK